MLSAIPLQQMPLERLSSKARGTGDRVGDDCRSSDAPAPSAASSGMLDILAGLVIGLVLCVLVIH